MSQAVPASIEWAALLISFGALAVASVSDFKSREVSNKVWLVYGPLALLLFITRVALSFDIAAVLLVSALATVVVALLLFQFGAVGGADSKALMCLGLALPIPPGFLAAYWQPPFQFYPFPISVLVNSFLLSVAAGLFILSRNVVQGLSRGRSLFQGFERESFVRKLMVLFTSYKTSFNLLQSRPYLYPAEQVQVAEAGPIRHFRIVTAAEEDRERLVSGLENYKAQGLFSDGVWVTPGMPHLVFLTASLAAVLFVGDLLMWMFFKIVGYS